MLINHFYFQCSRSNINISRIFKRKFLRKKKKPREKVKNVHYISKKLFWEGGSLNTCAKLVKGTIFGAALLVRIEPSGQTVLVEAALANKITALLLLTLVLVVVPFIGIPVSSNYLMVKIFDSISEALSPSPEAIANCKSHSQMLRSQEPTGSLQEYSPRRLRTIYLLARISSHSAHLRHCFQILQLLKKA